MAQNTHDNSNTAPFDFIAVADSKYFEPVLLSVKQVRRLYPQSAFYIYDWGFSEEEQKSLEELGVTLLPWQKRFVPLNFHLGLGLTIKKLLGIARWRDILYHLKQGRLTIPRAENLFATFRSEQLFYNKFLCLADFAKAHNRFIFLDADAFLINNVDEVLHDKADLVLTVRPIEERSIERNRCGILNVGVMFFLGGSEKNRAITHEWEKQALGNPELLIEQTALTRLLISKKPDIFEHTNALQEIELGGHTIKIKILPCEIYNYNWIERFDPERDGKTVKILHFKSDRFRTPLFKKVAKNLNLEI